jgi:hypothetical protein
MSSKLAWSAGHSAERNYSAWEKAKTFARAAVRLENPLVAVAKKGLLGLYDIPEAKWVGYRALCNRKGAVFDDAEGEFEWALAAYRFLKPGREEREHAPRTLKIIDAYRKISVLLETSEGEERKRLAAFLDDIHAMADALMRSGAVTSKDGVEDLSRVVLLHSMPSSPCSRSFRG